ncbi:peptide chain release factor N(5)-glutamine methyltransferase [Paenibacillus lemnae]|uniref:Release factor glutamine methyltransferase n=2 Tax=Paenibacillus lemnae TaxID=1330551 RepID=A0A848M2P4_PAELE|nr:peptide chain release factor N(5)-glutamine methyltransferase [Paenibacillus lemnae]
MEPQRNAQLLLEHILGLSGTSYYMALPEPFPQELRAAWEHAVTRKATGEPAQYITGEQEFYGRMFKVTPEVLIPRPETELLVEAVLKAAQSLSGSNAGGPGRGLKQDGRGDLTDSGAGSVPPVQSLSLREGSAHQMGSASFTVADIGTGSGAIAVTLALESPSWCVLGSDISPGALEVARQNAGRLGAEIQFRQGNLLEPFAGMVLDVLVSNPPYIPACDIQGLQPEVRDHEPRTALDGGADGLYPYRIMMEQISLLAAPPRLIAFELGMGQAGDVAELLRKAGYWSQIETVKDLAGIERHVLGISQKL